MRRLELNRHALAAALLCAAAVLAACLAAAASGGAVTASAVSAAPRAAVDEVGTPADALFPAGGPSMAAARSLAERHWGELPCDGEVAIGWTVQEDGTNATASWRNPSHAWDNAGENFDCRIDFNARADFDWPKLCTVMAHEVGHLLGRQHAGDPGDLMAPLYAGPLAACETADPARPASEPVVEVVVEEPQSAPAVTSRSVHGRAAARRRAARCRSGRRALSRSTAPRRLRCRSARAKR